MDKIKCYKQIRKSILASRYWLIQILNYCLDFILDKDQILKEIEKLDQAELEKLLENAKQKNKSISIFKYKDPRIKDLIWQLKFNNNRKVARIFSRFLWEKIKKIVGQNHKIKNIILVPIPIHKKRRAERGYNQCEWLCEEIIKIQKNEASISGRLKFSNRQDRRSLINRLNLFYCSKILIRQKYTIKQSWVSKKDRIKNIQKVFRLSNRKKWDNVFCQKKFLRNQTLIIIVDDVYTTGSTINEAVQTLSKMNFRILPITIAS